jgi:hypothetical protein
MQEGDIVVVAELLVRAAKLAQYVQRRLGEGADPNTGTGSGSGSGTGTGTGTGTDTRRLHKPVSLSAFTAALSGPGADPITAAEMASLKVYLLYVCMYCMYTYFFNHRLFFVCHCNLRLSHTTRH